MEHLKKYDLHKDDYSKLHFEVNHARPYFDKHVEKATKPHRHSFFQVIWFKNQGSHYVDFEVVDHPANAVFFINRNQVHHFCKESSNEGYLFHFNDLFFAKNDQNLLDRFSISVFNEINSHYVSLSKQETEKIEMIVSLITSELAVQDANYDDLVFHYFQTVLLTVERLHKVQANLGMEASPAFSLAVSFKREIVARLDKFLSINEYAEALNTTAKTLTRVSKQILDQTPAQVVKQLKILEAKRMLSHQTNAIQQVGYALGFDQSTYFTKYFKQEVGMTPKEFQQSVR